MIKSEFTSKYFGKITIDERDSHGDVDLDYKGHQINAFFTDFNLYGDKVKVCLEILDKYLEINEIAKKAILKNFSENEIIRYYFECHFDILEEEQLIEIFSVANFQQMDIESVVEKLEYPNLLFTIKDNKISVSIDYMISKKYSDEILCVKLDEESNITGFSHES